MKHEVHFIIAQTSDAKDLQIISIIAGFKLTKQALKKK